VVHDGAAQAADDVARFMEGVVFAGDAVFLRVPAPQVLRRSLGSFAVEPYPNHAVDLTGLMRLDEVRENRELKEYLEESPDKAAVVDAVVRGIPARFLGDDDLVLTVNRMPRFVLKEACGVLEWGFTGPPALRDAIQAHAEMLRPWMVRGMTGSIALHEGETVLRLCREFVNLATRELDSDKRFATLLRVLAETERKALPRLREMRPAEIGPDDLDALADVSPRAPGM